MKAPVVVQCLVILALIAGGAYWWSSRSDVLSISNFQQCVDAGYPVRESYPEVCVTPDGQSFINSLASTISPGSEREEIPTVPVISLSLSDATAFVKKYVAQSSGSPISMVKTIYAVEKDFSDSCLGIQKEGVMCAQVITPGYEIRVSVNGQISTFRISTNGLAIAPVPVN